MTCGEGFVFNHPSSQCVDCATDGGYSVTTQSLHDRIAVPELLWWVTSITNKHQLICMCHQKLYAYKATQYNEL